MGLVNLTPHKVTLVNGGLEWMIPPSGRVARVAAEKKKIGSTMSIPIYEQKFGEIFDLPEKTEGVTYIVSSLVLLAASGRDDLVAPDTSPESAIRGENGQIEAVQGLICNPRPEEKKED